MAEFSRSKQIKELIDSIGDGRIKVVTGVRRCGKTYLLKEILPAQLKKKDLVGSVGDVLIIELKGKDHHIKTRNQLWRFLTSKANKYKRFIVIDEIQKIRDFYGVLIDFKQLYPARELFVTGSNSKMLSKDILRNLQESGTEIHLRPLTFQEIRETVLDYSVDVYLRYGGLPFIVNAKDEEKETELNRIYQELYEEDIKDKLKNRFAYLSKIKIGQILKTIFSTTSEVSVNGIAARITKGADPSRFDILKLKSEIEEAIQILMDSYLIQEFDNDSFNDLDILKNIGLNKKYYCVDNGLLYINCDDENRVDGIVLENAVYLHLTEKGIKPRGKIMLGENGNKVGEVDFNYNSDGKDHHIQVTYVYHDGDYGREVGNLLLFKDDSVKTLVFRHDASTIEKDPLIEYIDCESFLLQ